MIELTDLVAVSLAAWRVAVFGVEEGGPWSLMTRIRTLFGVYHDDDGIPISSPTSMPGSLFGCTWCLSAWTAVAFYGILLVEPRVVFVLAAWGAASFLDNLRVR